MLKDVRNIDGKLVAQIDDDAGEVVIAMRGCITKIHLGAEGRISVTNSKAETPDAIKTA